MEVDGISYSQKDPNSPVFVIELKTHIKTKDIAQLKKNMKIFRNYFTDFKGRTLFGLLGGIKISEQTKNEIFKNGIYLAIAGRDQFKLVEYPKSFKPYFVD